MFWTVSHRLTVLIYFLFLSLSCVLGTTQSAFSQSTSFMQAVAEASARDEDISIFYRASGYSSIWTGRSPTDRKRRAALVEALENANRHGLPTDRYGLEKLKEDLKSARSARDRGILEIEMSRVFLRYATDVQTGVLVPSEVDELIVREVPYRARDSYLMDFSQSKPTEFFRNLPPQSMQYNALMKQKLLLERLLAKGGWGPIARASKLEVDDSGPSVVSLRDRLVKMGYLKRSASKTYGQAMKQAVIHFQKDHGLEQDGVVGKGTLAEINTSAEKRLQSIIVALERERWVNMERGARHVEVNLTDFTAKIIDNGIATFATRAVIGAPDDKRQSPEFSDQMEFMVINPSWFVPRSIATKEYLPKLKQDPYAVGHLILTDQRGRQINRGSVDFNRFTARSFPYAMRQPPSQSNALGLVKFMFPNKHNIYLHDTPAKNLFARETRAYSHGCIRLADPFGFAYALLEPQTDDPESFFQTQLATNKEKQVDLAKPVPVHLIYRTAFTNSKGQIEYRRDIYGRDARIWDALLQAGVALRAVQG